jgi:hypothetical protein
MSELRKAAQQALIVLRCIEYDSCETVVDGPDKYMCDDAYEALRAALAQPEQEPQWDEVFDAAVRAYVRSAQSREMLRLCFQNKSDSDAISIGWTAQELMAFAKGIASIYTDPPQRKPLTDEALMALLPGAVRLPPGWKDFARSIEREHRIL